MGKIFYKGIDYSSPTSSGVSGVKGNKETVYRVGNVNITPENVGALAENGDSKDNTVTYTSADDTTADAWTDVAVLATGEKHSSIFAKISTMFKNIRYIYTHFIKSENILDTLEEIVRTDDKKRYELIRKWTIEGIFITKITEDDFDRASTDKRQLQVDFSYDRATQSFTDEENSPDEE